MEFDNIVIDLSYDDKKYRIKYPQSEDFTILLTPNFLKEKQVINMIILKKQNKKYSKIAKGELNILKKYFIGNQLKIEKYVYLTLFKSFKNDLILESQEIPKIFVRINLLEPIDHLKKENNQKDQNKKINQKKLNTDNNNYTNPNDNIDDLKIKNQFDDDLSDLSISLIENEEEEKKEKKIDILINDDYIQKLKDLISSDFETFLPKDIEKLKQINKSLYEKFIESSNLYNENLMALNNNNEEIREKAKKYYEDYKKLKKEIYKGRVDLKKKNKELKKDIDIINEEKNNLSKEIEKIKKETQELRNKLNITDEEEKNDNLNDKNDIKTLTEILLKLNNIGCDIFNTSRLNDEEKNKLKKLLNIQENKNDENNEKNNNQNENLDDNNFSEENIKDNIELGNLIVSLIERDVNDLYSKQIIDNVKIDQINAITYSFENNKLTKNVTLKIQNDNLFCDNGVSFNSWLINNFGI